MALAKQNRRRSSVCHRLHRDIGANGHLRNYATRHDNIRAMLNTLLNSVEEIQRYALPIEFLLNYSNPHGLLSGKVGEQIERAKAAEGNLCLEASSNGRSWLISCQRSSIASPARRWHIWMNFRLGHPWQRKVRGLVLLDGPGTKPPRLPAVQNLR
jgi:hypothetical protein